ncbi:MAG: protein-L-isoaspartate(D-aspartate) O-methyltransferase [Dehalococcoidia bacterium]|nr:MAG: protein-L-isoaspartate(D-aspartate) O-methyltransferase [Dehalococcoidia bacterium]
MLERERMVREQIERRGITDELVLESMRKVKRHLFVPEDLQASAYADGALPIGHKQTISQPYIVAFMTQAIQPGPDDRVLEIGTGSGYQTAVLAEIVKEVYTVEILQPLAESSGSLLEEMGYKNIIVKHGDGYNGCKEHAPFDVIVVTAAPPMLPEELVSQLKTGGRMIVPVGESYQELYLITKTETGFAKKALLPVAFVPMVRSTDNE